MSSPGDGPESRPSKGQTVFPVAHDTGAIVQRASWLLTGRVIGDAGMFVYYLLLARRFGTSGIGNYSFAFAVGSMLMLGVSFGMRDLITRRVARRPGQVPRIAFSVLATQAAITALLLGLLLAASLALNYSPTMIGYLALAFFALALMIIGITFTSFLDAIGAMHLSALANLIHKASIMLPGVALILGGASLLLVMCAHVFAGLMFIVAGFFWTRRRFGALRLRYRPGVARALFIAALPFLATSALWEIYSRVDIVMLHYFRGDAATGLYAAAYKVVSAPYFAAELIGIAVFPTLARALAGEEERTWQLFRETLRTLVVFGLAGAILLAVAGDGLQVFLFGSEFAESGRIIQWMAPLLLLQFAMVPLWRLLLAMDRERLLVKLRLGSVGLNIALNLFLIPRFGAMGAVASSLVSESVLGLAQFGFCLRIVSAPFNGRGIAIALSGSAALLAGLLVRTVVAWPLAAVAAMMVFAGLVLGLRVVLPAEIRDVMRQARLKGSGGAGPSAG